MPLKVDLNDVEPGDLSVSFTDVSEISLEALTSGEAMAEVGASCVVPPCSCCLTCCCCSCGD